MKQLVLRCYVCATRIGNKPFVLASPDTHVDRVFTVCEDCARSYEHHTVIVQRREDLDRNARR